MALAMFFLFVCATLLKFYTLFCVKIPGQQEFLSLLKLLNLLIDTNNHATFTITKITFIPHSDV